MKLMIYKWFAIWKVENLRVPYTRNRFQFVDMFPHTGLRGYVPGEQIKLGYVPRGKSANRQKRGYVPVWANAQVPKTVDMFLSGIGRTGMRYVPVISFPRATWRRLF